MSSSGGIHGNLGGGGASNSILASYSREYFSPSGAGCFAPYYDNRVFTDARLSASAPSDLVVNCHRVVLAAVSPFLRKRFINSPDPAEVIRLPAVGHNAMLNVLELVYRGKVKIRRGEDDDAFRAAMRSLAIRLGPEIDRRVYDEDDEYGGAGTAGMGALGSKRVEIQPPVKMDPDRASSSSSAPTGTPSSRLMTVPPPPVLRNSSSSSSSAVPSGGPSSSSNMTPGVGVGRMSIKPDLSLPPPSALKRPPPPNLSVPPPGTTVNTNVPPPAAMVPPPLTNRPPPTNLPPPTNVPPPNFSSSRSGFTITQNVQSGRREVVSSFGAPTSGGPTASANGGDDMDARRRMAISALSGAFGGGGGGGGDGVRRNLPEGIFGGDGGQGRNLSGLFGGNGNGTSSFPAESSRESDPPAPLRGSSAERTRPPPGDDDQSGVSPSKRMRFGMHDSSSSSAAAAAPLVVESSQDYRGREGVGNVNAAPPGRIFWMQVFYSDKVNPSEIRDRFDKAFRAVGSEEPGECAFMAFRERGAAQRALDDLKRNLPEVAARPVADVPHDAMKSVIFDREEEQGSVAGPTVRRYRASFSNCPPELPLIDFKRHLIRNGFRHFNKDSVSVQREGEFEVTFFDQDEMQRAVAHFDGSVCYDREIKVVES